MKAISEKSMLILAALALGLIITWLIASDRTPVGSPGMVSTDTEISTAVHAEAR